MTPPSYGSTIPVPPNLVKPSPRRGHFTIWAYGYMGNIALKGGWLIYMHPFILNRRPPPPWECIGYRILRTSPSLSTTRIDQLGYTSFRLRAETLAALSELAELCFVHLPPASRRSIIYCILCLPLMVSIACKCCTGFKMHANLISAECHLALLTRIQSR